MSTTSPVFEARDIQVIRGGARILRVPRLTVAEGEILSLIGPNGAGKSTLLQTLAALARPSQGEVLFRGKRIETEIPLLAYRRRLAMVLQEPLLFDTTVYSNVASGLKIRGMRRSRIEPIVNRALVRFGIAHLRDRSARTLSGGEARRVSIARAFATDPEVLLLDEPFSALDPIIREALMEDLEHVLRETRITTIFVTHDRMEAIRLASRIGVMKAGEILQIGAPDEVMNHPVDEFVASFVGIETILRGRVVSGNSGIPVVFAGGQAVRVPGPVQTGEEVTLCIRPEHVTLSAPGSEALPGMSNRLAGKLEKITPVGPYRKVRLDCGFPLVAYVPSHALPALSLKEGAEAFASFEAEAVHVISKKSPAAKTS
ncbi:MAG: ABC transporter ATP-binding protein [Thermodesulfobacteriota bacterium]